MDFDYQFFKDIVLVGIPVGVGALTSKWLTNSWQVRSEKSKIKRDILIDFQNSAKRVGDILNVATMMLYDNYAMYDLKDKTSTETHNVQMRFLADEKELPLYKFAREYEQFKKDLRESTFNGSKFLSSLRLYYRSNELEAEYSAIFDQHQSSIITVHQLFHSKNVEEFVTLYKEWSKLDDTTKAMQRSFELKLIDTNLHKLTI